MEETKFILVDADREPLLRYGNFEDYESAESVAKKLWADGYEVYVANEPDMDRRTV